MKTVIFPGQGAQFIGMGKNLFADFPKMTMTASEILGYDIKELCLEDLGQKLNLTEYTQPALYVVHALYYLKFQTNGEQSPDFFAGHSLGEYNALLAAGAFDFETGLKLVQKRGQIMSQAKGGGMLAVLGVSPDVIKKLIDEHNFNDIDVANYNTPTQTIISGSKSAIDTAILLLEKSGVKVIPLKVSGAFHSRYMKKAQDEFQDFVERLSFNRLKVPVIANVTARPYPVDQIKPLLCKQLSSPVLWCESIRYLLGKGVEAFVETGESPILTKMIAEIRKTAEPLIVAEETIDEFTVLQPQEMPSATQPQSISSLELNVNNHQSQKKLAQSQPSIQISPENLGCAEFKKDYGIRYAYLSGSMYKAIASQELVVKMGNSGLMGFLGTGGLSLEAIEQQIQYIQRELKQNASYGLNLLCNFNNPDMEMQTVDLYLRYSVRYIEASAFVNITPALVRYRLNGLQRDGKNHVHCQNRILAKISRPEVARVFMSPPPERIVNDLLKQRLVTDEQAELATNIPMSHEICVEADSGGHTDMGVPTVLLPTMIRLRDEISTEYAYDKQIRVGMAGGIGTPEAAASAFVMGADFIMTGSINQCTVESGASSVVKAWLQEMNIQDTEYAPAGDMFELGAKVQVLKKGTFFAARANKLYEIYRHYDGLEEIPATIINQLERHYFKKSLKSVWEETRLFLQNSGLLDDLERAETTPKHKMALIFRWYFFYSSRLALDGITNDKVNFQIHTGPALGAFNQWVKGTDLEHWKNRHVDEIGEKIMRGTAEFLTKQMQRFCLPNSEIC